MHVRCTATSRATARARRRGGLAPFRGKTWRLRRRCRGLSAAWMARGDDGGPEKCGLASGAYRWCRRHADEMACAHGPLLARWSWSGFCPCDGCRTRCSQPRKGGDLPADSLRDLDSRAPRGPCGCDLGGATLCEAQSRSPAGKVTSGRTRPLARTRSVDGARAWGECPGIRRRAPAPSAGHGATRGSVALCSISPSLSVPAPPMQSDGAIPIPVPASTRADPRG